MRLAFGVFAAEMCAKRLKIGICSWEEGSSRRLLRAVRPTNPRHTSVPANSVAKPPCADTPKRRRMARRGHIRRYADTTVGGLGWLTPIRAYAGTQICRYADTPGKHADTPIQEQIRRYADPGGKYADTPSGQGLSVYRCIGAGLPRPSPLPSPLPSFPPPLPPFPLPPASRPHLPCPGLRQRAGKQSPVKLNNLSGFPGLGFIGFTRV